MGDFTKFSEDKVSYLQKIIYKKVTLPFDLQPQNIWRDYKRELEDKINKRLKSKKFEELIANDGLFDMLETSQKNLRDRVRFNDMVNQELFEHDKIERVQIDEQLLIIYLYLFHPGRYEKLRNYRGDVPYQTIEKTSIDNAIQAMMDSDAGKYPLPFKKNKSAYLIYESVNNLSILEAEKIMNKDAALEKYILSDADEDFYQYLTTHYNSYRSTQEKMFEMVVQHVKNRQRSDLMQFIIDNEVNSRVNNVDQNISYAKDDNYTTASSQGRLVITDQIDLRKKLLEDQDLDLSEIVFVLTNLYHFSYGNVKDHYEDLELDIIGNYRFKDIALLLYLAQKGLWEECNSWDDMIIHHINNFTAEEFVYFAEKIGIIKPSRFNFVEVNMYLIKGHDENGDLVRESIKNTIEKLKPSFNKLGPVAYSDI